MCGGEREERRTTNELHQPPETEEHEQTRELPLAPAQHDLEHEGSQHDHRVEEVQGGVGPDFRLRAAL